MVWAMTRRPAAWFLFLLVAPSCARPAPPEVAAAASTLDVAAVAPASPSPLPAASASAALPLEKDAGRAADRAPSIELLRDLLAERESARDLVDPVEGFSVLDVGPQYNPETGESSHRSVATKSCGPRARVAAREQARFHLSANGPAEQNFSCSGLQCAHAANGEWDSDERFVFARKSGRLVLISYERVLDVPMRSDADEDRAWLVRKRGELAKQRCPSP